jgi:hypothetical protein
LYDEHRSLALKKVTNELTAAEQRRLEFVRWQLDKISDAEYGERLDVLEALINQHRELQRQIDQFSTGVKHAVLNRGR